MNADFIERNSKVFIRKAGGYSTIVRGYSPQIAISDALDVSLV